MMPRGMNMVQGGANERVVKLEVRMAIGFALDTMTRIQGWRSLPCVKTRGCRHGPREVVRDIVTHNYTSRPWQSGHKATGEEEGR